MKLTAPLKFEPIFMERVWGGRQLEQLYGKRLPPGARIGESWEIVDRVEAQSVVHEGPLRGETLNDLWRKQRAEVFGRSVPDTKRFPLLVKLLDAQERLSVQVHPPQKMARKLKGESKTEMWYFAHAKRASDIFAGLKKGVTRESFEAALKDGSVAEQIHRIKVKSGDAIFIPSGRVHAIGAGNVIVEVQENSDTTYRVFDWNRLGLDGKPRALHIDESLASIDFEDIEPALARPEGELLVTCDLFRTDRWEVTKPRPAAPPGRIAIFGVLEGEVECGEGKFLPGEFFLVPAGMKDRTLRPLKTRASLLRTTFPG